MMPYNEVIKCFDEAPRVRGLSLMSGHYCLRDNNAAAISGVYPNPVTLDRKVHPEKFSCCLTGPMNTIQLPVYRQVLACKYGVCFVC